MIFFGILESETVCANCSHWMGHYVYIDRGNSYVPLSCGHCRYPRLKHRRPGDTCVNFEMLGR
jgi:hypothetical protein